MPDYSNPTTRLTANRYAWDVTFRGPSSHGTVTTQRIEGSYDTQPGATVGSLLAGLTNLYARDYAQGNGIRAADIVIVSYSLREQ